MTLHGSLIALRCRYLTQIQCKISQRRPVLKKMHTVHYGLTDESSYVLL